jgi:hypothetical protein
MRVANAARNSEQMQIVIAQYDLRDLAERAYLPQRFQ